MKKYKVFWVDDEHQSLFNIRQMAIDEGIELIAFDNAETAIADLKENFLWYDAAILDGLFYNIAVEEGIATRQTALMNVVNSLKDIRPKKHIPWFILTGKENIKNENDFIQSEGKEDCVYDKLDNNQIQKLYTRLKNEADHQFETQLIHKYQDSFEIFDFHLDKDTKYDLLKILTKLYSESTIEFDDYNSIRIILEKLFNKLKYLNIISPDIKSLNGCSLFLNCRHNEFEFSKKIIHPVIGELIFRTLNIAQDGSHSGEKLSFRVQEYCSKYNAKHLYSSIVHSLLEILSYFNLFLNDIESVEKSKCLWIRKNIIAGEIAEISANQYGTFISENGTRFSVLPIHMDQYSLTLHQKIRIEPKEDNPLHIKNIFLD
ncbi:response regulator [Chryseobacterium koreense]|uniref:Uncharacterized protein n=1 Tax=Chryseobacterium koreense CCUG 49689 TaxID=1304281 RepID=A0A0J7LP08_9FLAO|nr:response regulator [Chryseobacterium koreense]KMQ70815.1 hypothetical protein ACM44_09255 [Chryseobacterium koreense CCUG 49689]MBB5332547.1 hypothetical protein [Chryseobacterium koreense]